MFDVYGIFFFWFSYNDIILKLTCYEELTCALFMQVNESILKTIKKNLNEGWVSNRYNWKEEFVNMYCSNWFYTSLDCFYAIENDACVYSNILYFTIYHGHEYTTTVHMFNTYVYIYALRSLEEDPAVLEQIRNIQRIQQMRRVVPLVLYRLLPSDLVPNVQSWLDNTY